jgi:hypothetical protein
VKRRFREQVIRVLQGNPYTPETLQRAREMIAIMREAHEQVMKDPNNLLRPDVFQRVSARRGEVASGRTSP